MYSKTKRSIEKYLLSTYGTQLIKLEDISEDYFDLSPTEAERKAANDELPVSTVQFNGETCVTIWKLAEYLAPAVECLNKASKPKPVFSKLSSWFSL